MNRTILLETALCFGLSLLGTGCERKATANESTVAGTGPTLGTVEPDLDANNFKVDHPERFPLATAGEHIAAPELNVTGVVSPDISRQVPVPSLASVFRCTTWSAFGLAMCWSLASCSRRCGPSSLAWSTSSPRRSSSRRCRSCFKAWI